MNFTLIVGLVTGFFLAGFLFYYFPKEMRGLFDTILGKNQKPLTKEEIEKRKKQQEEILRWAN
ncbi:hypothetical protein DRQ26_00700 [bacterium]|nr:MAG: hypothetical protein DRQ26_00700 [bacterium]